LSYWGKLLGGVAGFAVGGPFGAMVGAALGHAADSGSTMTFRSGSAGSGNPFSSARVAALLGRREQVFAIAVVVLSAKLAKVDGPVNRVEIDAFRRYFRIPAGSLRDVGRLFDQARDSSEGFQGYADQLGVSFSDTRGVLEDVLAALTAIAAADGPINPREQAYLRRVHEGFGLDRMAWDRASTGTSRNTSSSDEPDPYAVLGLLPSAKDDEIRAAWKRLMRENHPDSLASRGVPQEFIAKATEKVARINAAWDRIKRDRQL
jgi:DnaJ like chaperone protein